MEFDDNIYDDNDDYLDENSLDSKEKFRNYMRNYLERLKYQSELQHYLQSELELGNSFIHIPMKFTGINNYPLYLVFMCGKNAKPNVPIELNNITGLFSIILN